MFRFHAASSGAGCRLAVLSPENFRFLSPSILCFVHIPPVLNYLHDHRRLIARESLYCVFRTLCIHVSSAVIAIASVTISKHSIASAKRRRQSNSVQETHKVDWLRGLGTSIYHPFGTMIRLNRSRFLGIVCLVTFIYFLLFTDSGSSSSEFRANTEAGLARKQQRERNLPLRGHLSDEDLTKKTHDELQGILNSPSREGVKKDEYGKPVGRVYREPQHDAPTHEDLARGGMTREEPARHNGAGQREQQKMSHEESLVAEDPGAAERKTTHGSTGAAPRPERKNPSKAGAGDADIDSAEDPGDAFVTKKLEEYLKSPGRETVS